MQRAGPRAVRRAYSAAVDARTARLFPGIKRLCDLVIERGQGSTVTTTDGVPYLDMTAGIGVTSTGHCHPKVVAAVQEQATKLTHAQMSCFYSDISLELAERLTSMDVAPGMDHAFFANSGAEAVENAVRVARQATQRDGVIAMLGGYHGRTAQALALTTSGTSYRGQHPGPLPAGTVVAPFPYEYAGVSQEAALDGLHRLMASQASPAEIAALILEPIQGEGGYTVPPAGYVAALRSFCDEHGILLIADEVQSGVGRTGRMWALDHECAPRNPEPPGAQAPLSLLRASGVAAQGGGVCRHYRHCQRPGVRLSDLSRADHRRARRGAAREPELVRRHVRRQRRRLRRGPRDAGRDRGRRAAGEHAAAWPTVDGGARKHRSGPPGRDR